MRSDPRVRRARRVAVSVGLAIIVASAGCSTSGGQSQIVEEVDPVSRVVRISTTACGDASRTTGTGVLIGGGRILTAAHVVIGAGDLRVDHGDDGTTFSARPAVIDTVRDLAVLVAEPDPDPGLARIELVDVGRDDALVMAAMLRGPAGTDDGRAHLSSVTVDRAVLMTVDEVRGTRRVTRSGFELAARILGGDSGSGIFDERGRLAGIVFAEATVRDAAGFAVGADEIRAVLSAPERPYACRPTRSRVTPTYDEPAISETPP